MSDVKSLHRKVRIGGEIRFETAFHIGSGREGLLSTDMGVLTDPPGTPILPGSSLKGNFRAAAERLGSHLGMTACLMDKDLSGVPCVTDERYRKTMHDDFKKLPGEREKLVWLLSHTCDICQLFGSPYQGSRIFFSDGKLGDWAGGLQIRDGVCLNRDSRTAVPGAKYDFEVVPAGAVFSISITLENPQDREIALVGAVVTEWEEGFKIGGFVSRGLGGAKLVEIVVSQVDFRDTSQLRAYLLGRKMTAAPTLLKDTLEACLNGKGEANA